MFPNASIKIFDGFTSKQNKKHSVGNNKKKIQLTSMNNSVSFFEIIKCCYCLQRTTKTFEYLGVLFEFTENVNFPRTFSGIGC